jgi:hypothetical protein
LDSSLAGYTLGILCYDAIAGLKVTYVFWFPAVADFLSIDSRSGAEVLSLIISSKPFELPA